jgi:hypothetical protein
MSLCFVRVKSEENASKVLIISFLEKSDILLPRKEFIVPCAKMDRKRRMNTIKEDKITNAQQTRR